ncbi:hypothetical protein [Pseudomonas hormoni]
MRNPLMRGAIRVQASAGGALTLMRRATPLWTMLFAVLFEGDRIDRGRAIGLVLGLLGLGLVITRGDIQVLLGLKVATGDAIILAGSIAWAANMVGTRRNCLALAASFWA